MKSKTRNKRDNAASIRHVFGMEARTLLDWRLDWRSTNSPTTTRTLVHVPPTRPRAIRQLLTSTYFPFLVNKNFFPLKKGFFELIFLY